MKRISIMKHILFSREIDLVLRVQIEPVLLLHLLWKKSEVQNFHQSLQVIISRKKLYTLHKWNRNFCLQFIFPFPHPEPESPRIKSPKVNPFSSPEGSVSSTKTEANKQSCDPIPEVCSIHTNFCLHFSRYFSSLFAFNVYYNFKHSQVDEEDRHLQRRTSLQQDSKQVNLLRKEMTPPASALATPPRYVMLFLLFWFYVFPPFFISMTRFFSSILTSECIRYRMVIMKKGENHSTKKLIR